MKRRYVRLVAVAVIALCAGQSFPAKKQSKLTELEKISLEFKNLADKVVPEFKNLVDKVVKGGELQSIKGAWTTKWKMLEDAMVPVYKLIPHDSNVIWKANANIIDYQKTIFEKQDPTAVDKKFIENARSSIAIKTTDTPATKQIKTAQRELLFQLKRIVEYMDPASRLERISLEFKNLADKVVLKKQELVPIKEAWSKNCEQLTEAINLVKFNMPKTGSDSMKPTNAGSIANAYKQFDELWRNVFAQRAVDKNFIEDVRTAIAIIPGYTWAGGDAPGTRSIKTALRNALLELKRIVEHAPKTGTGQQNVQEEPGEETVEIEYD